MPKDKITDLQVNGHVVRVVVRIRDDGTVLAYPEANPNIVAKAGNEDTVLKLLGDVLLPPPATASQDAIAEDTSPSWQFWEKTLS